MTMLGLVPPTLGALEPWRWCAVPGVLLQLRDLRKLLGSPLRAPSWKLTVSDSEKIHSQDAHYRDLLEKHRKGLQAGYLEDLGHGMA